MLSIVLLALAGPSADLPNGNRMRPTDQCFTITRISTDGPVAIGTTRQIVRATTVAGKTAWDVVVHQRIASLKFDMRDHFVLMAKDLRPIAFDSQRDGKTHAKLVYRGDRVSGTRTNQGQVVPIDLTVGQVWEGNLWGVTFGALPLASGKRFNLPYYQHDKGLGQFDLQVTGSESVLTPNGPIDAWTVDVQMPKGPPVTYLIGKADGAELGSRSAMFGTHLGGDCSGLG